MFLRNNSKTKANRKSWGTINIIPDGKKLNKNSKLTQTLQQQKIVLKLTASTPADIPTLKTLKWKFWNNKKEKKGLISNSQIHSVTALIYYATMSHCWRGRRLNSIFHVRANLATYFTLLCTIFVRPWPKPLNT